jgi:hypothetical protein
MKPFVKQKLLPWRLVLLLIIASFAVSACSIIAEPEDTQTTFTGVPVVNIAAPLANDSYYEGVGVNIIVRVENAGPDIARVAVTLDGEIIGEASLPNSSGAPSFVVTNGWVATGVGAHTIGVTASRNDGTVSTPAEVAINVVAAPTSSTGGQSTNNQGTGDTTAPTQAPTTEAQGVQPTTAPTNTLAPTTPPEPTQPPAPTEVPATETPSRPQVRVVTGANIRRGPSTVFEPPIGSLAAGAVQDLLALSPDGQWYKIRYYNGDGWIFANTVEVVGSTADLPRDPGPATPIPVTPTPVSTATPVAVADLSIVSWSTAPFPLECGENSVTTVTIANSGTGNSTATRVRLEDLFNGSVTTTANADVGILAPGQNATITINMTVTSNHSQGHLLRVRVDPDNTLPETNEGNNQREAPYSPLEQGDCP